MPGKHEHVVYCRLSKRQRKLYEEYMSRTEVQDTLSSGNFLGVVGVLMQLRKVSLLSHTHAKHSYTHILVPCTHTHTIAAKPF